MLKHEQTSLLPRECKHQEQNRGSSKGVVNKDDFHARNVIVVDDSPIMFVNDSVDVESLESITWQHHFIPRTPCLWLLLGIEIALLTLLLIAVLTWDEDDK